MRRQAVGTAVLVLLLLLGGCKSVPGGSVIANGDQAKAAVIAWYSDPATHGAGSVAKNVAVAVEDRGAGWRVHISGDIHGQGAMYASVMIVDIDPSGTITVVAQG